jgi:hypothetical protein
MSAGDDPVDGSELPGIDFATFILSLSHNVLVHLGDAPDPTGTSQQPDFALARQTIDLLGLLEEKTRGNLTGQEERILSQTLCDLRVRFTEVSNKG